MNQAENLAAIAYCLGAPLDAALALAAAADVKAHSEWLEDAARIFLGLGTAPEEMRRWARWPGHEFMSEIADVMLAAKA